MKILQINTVGNCGSTGRIAEQIGISALREGFDSYIACGRKILPSKSHIVRIGSQWHRYPFVLWTRFFDSDCPLAKISTRKFISDIKKISPDIIHLHNIHGYYLHTQTLLKFLGEYGKPVVWTLHDCWPLTGHCSHFEYIGCNKWQSACGNCPQKKEYPASWFFDRSAKNHAEKIELISKIKNLTFVPVSSWLGNIVKKSKLANFNVRVIRNGVNLELFRPNSILENYPTNKTILFAANPWNKKKGLKSIPLVAKELGTKYKCIVVGVNQEQKKFLNGYNIEAFQKTDSAEKMRNLYASATVFGNPTLEEALSMVNMEAIACGTPVVTFNSGGTPETVPNDAVGAVVERGDISAMVSQIKKFADFDKSQISKVCRETAIDNFDAKIAYKNYCDLYHSINA